MVHGTSHRNSVALRVRQTGELVLAIAVRVQPAASRPGVQSRGRLFLVDHGRRAALSFVQVVRRRETAKKKLVALVFVI